MQLSQIGWVETCYSEKFGAPRQSGVVAEAWGKIKFCDEFRDPNFFRGLDGFSHLWLIFEFHQATAVKNKTLVRPPRLGGNEKLGVFATRSPFRPNALGLSVVKIDRIDLESEGDPCIYIKGIDLVDGTPLYDIKPYIKYCDSIPSSHSGYAADSPERMKVDWLCEIGDEQAKILVEQTLAVDPRPAYHDGDGREYGCCIDSYNVRWIVKDGVVEVLSCAGV